MKKIILPLIIFSFLFGTMAFAQEVELPDPGITPDSPFYFLDTLGEKMGMFFAFTAKKKAEKSLKYAEEKLAEVKAMAEQKEIKAMEKANQKYEKFLETANQKTQGAKEKGKDVEELAALITEKTLKHHEVLEEVFEKVPEQAKKGIENAIEASKKGAETAVRSVTGAKKEKLQQKIKTFDWQVFIDSNAGYSIKYPTGWRKVTFKNGMGVGPKEMREDILWGLWFYDSSQMSEEKVISQIGKQFELGRKVVRENIKFNNIQALKVIATTSQFPDWYSESIIIEHGGKIFHIGNGAVKDDKFKLFYKSFKFVEFKEAEDCEKIINNARKNRCYIGIAIKTKDSSHCEKLTDSFGKEMCYIDVAIETKDINLCKKITHDIQKNTCNAIVTNNADKCEGSTRSSWKDQCYFNVAQGIKDANLCEKITNIIDRTECYAIVTKDANVCEQITKGSRKDGCYDEIAEETKDANICEKITNSTLKKVCYSHIAGITMDSSLCEKSSDKSPCYADIAIETKDSNLCEKLTGREKNMCYWSVALGIIDPGLCEKINNGRIKDTCYISIAEKTKDSGLCEKITDSAIKEDCVEKTGAASAKEAIPGEVASGPEGLDARREKPKVEELEDKTDAQKKGVVAIVNEREVTNDEFIQKIRVYLGRVESQLRKSGQWQRANETEDEFIQRLMPLMGKGILEQMINEIILQQKAKEQNITVKSEEIDKKIDELKVTAQKLSESGMTIEELKQQVESQILMEKIVAKEVIVTEKDIVDYFESRKANFAKPEEIRASHILLKTEIEAGVILSQLKAGADFAELAGKESVDAITADKGGDLGFFSKGKMTPAFEEAAFALKAGEISEVVKTPYGYHIIKVIKKNLAQEPNLELAREEIRDTLIEQKTWTIKSNLLQNLKKEAKIEIISSELKD